MPTIGFVLVCGILIYTSYHISHDMINIVSVFTVPYMLIVPINNFIMIKRGFYTISEQVLCLIGGSLVCIFIGYIITNTVLKVHNRLCVYQEQKIENKFSHYKMQEMLKYICIVEAAALLRLTFIIITHGLTYISNESFSGHMLSGPLGHLLLTIYPLIPILFLYWLKNKKQVLYLIATILCLGLLFTTFVKYHIIGMIVLIYLFVTLEDRRYLRKGLILVSAFAIGAFVLNYLTSFTLRGTVAQVAQDYYINHLWNYMAGSIIHDNLIFTNGINIGLSLLWKIARVILTPINTLFISLFGSGMATSEVGNPLGYVPVGSNGEWGNVIDTFGHFYPSKGSPLELLLYIVFLIIFGCILTVLYNRSMQKSFKFYISTSVILVFFCFFSFFGTFYALLPAWEILVYSFIFPTLFDQRIKIRFH